MDDKHAFAADERSAIYKCIATRRDVRSEFLGRDIPNEVLAKLLMAAHQAPSVGLSQPWNFVIVCSPEIKAAIYEGFQLANTEAAQRFDTERAQNYRSIKLEGIREAPIGICVTCDKSRGGEVVLGKTHQSEMDVYSVVCAIQNLWLAARAEGIGTGWMSIIEPERLRRILGLPLNIAPIAYLCVGYVSSFYETPELEQRQWATRNALKDLVSIDGWDNRNRTDKLYEWL